MSWGNPQSSQEKLLCGLMSPLSLGYGIGSYFRLAAYSKGYVKRVRLPVPVVSIGNITCGGTGKTPMAIDVTRRLIAAGYKVAVLSRGYARKSKQKITVVSNGQGEFALCEEAGDEPLLIALSVPEAIVIVGSSRVETAALAIEEYKADAIVLDDGFQHIRLERDLDVVLIDYNDDPENDTLLPAGRLREPLTALNRAKVVVITKVPLNPDEERLEKLRTQIRKYAERAEIVAARFVPKRLRTSTGEAPLTQLKGQRVVAFCGVARPEGFAATLNQLGCTLMRNANASSVVTTEKDMVKIAPHDRLNQHLVAVEIGVEWLGPLPSHISDLMKGKMESQLKRTRTNTDTDAEKEKDTEKNSKSDDGDEKPRARKKKNK
jgi:tetraacyldisaccharide 4'-kinase